MIKHILKREQEILSFNQLDNIHFDKWMEDHSLVVQLLQMASKEIVVDKETTTEGMQSIHKAFQIDNKETNKLTTIVDMETQTNDLAGEQPILINIQISKPNLAH